jgi:hypothetical protein
MFIKFVYLKGPCEEIIECESVERLPAPAGPDITYQIHLKGEHADIINRVVTLKDLVDVYYMSESGKTVDKIIHTPHVGVPGPSVMQEAGSH